MIDETPETPEARHARLSDEALDVAMLDESPRIARNDAMSRHASALRRHYEGELLRETMRAGAWRAKCDRQWTWLLVFVWLALALAVALVWSNWWRLG